jgi:hypothetical protein
VPQPGIFRNRLYGAANAIPKFEAETGIQVSYDVHDASEVLEAKLLAGRSGYYIVVPSATTLPMAAFASVRLGVNPEGNALAKLFLGVVFVLVSAAFWLIVRSERRQRLHTFPPR